VHIIDDGAAYQKPGVKTHPSRLARTYLIALVKSPKAFEIPEVRAKLLEYKCIEAKRGVKL
jgi:hypothetical protein